MSRIFRYNGAEFSVDFNDADFFERYWDACEQLGKSEEELKNNKNERGFMRKYCDMFYAFFDNLFGKGAGDKIYQGRHNVAECEKIYMRFIGFCGAEVKKFNEDRVSFAKVNRQGMNRKQRRQATKNVVVINDASVV